MVHEFDRLTYTNHAIAEGLLNNGQFYTSLFDYHPDGVYAIDTEGHFILANPALQNITGFSLNDLIQQKFTCLQTSDPVLRTERFRKALAGTPQKYETVVYHKEGHTLDVFITLTPIVVDDNVVGVFGFAKDISERKRQEEEFRKTQALFTLLSENTQDLITISEPHGITRYISKSITSTLGYEPEEVIGLPTIAFWHPDDVERVSQLGLPDTGSFECRVRHKAGHYLWFETVFKNIFNEHNQLESIIGVGRDITLRKQAEEELLETKELLDSFIDQNVDAIAFFDSDGKMTRVNASYEQMFGWPKEQILGLNLAELPNIPEKYREDAKETALITVSNQVIIGTEKCRLRNDGSTIFVRMSSFPLRHGDGHVQGWAVVMRDLTEQKKAEELLLQTEKLSVVGQLAAGIAHEIRNPLTALKGFTQLLKGNGGKESDYLKIMETEMNRIESILSELLVLAKPQAKAVHDEVDIVVLIQDVIALMQSQANLFNIVISFQCEVSVVSIACDQNQLKQVFINFIKNAIEAMPTGGQLTIELKCLNDAQISIRFQDQGVGIPPYLLKRIGEPFYTTKEKGTGLGMMVSKKIIENHRGTLQVASEVQVGTTVEVMLPIAPV